MNPSNLFLKKTSHISSSFLYFLRTSSGFFIGLFFALLLTLIVGENPVHIFLIIMKSAFGSAYDLGLTLFYTTSLIFTGLSVAIAFRGGLFNIGAEGQLTMSALGMVGFAYLFPEIPRPFSYVAIFLVGSLCGAVWAFIPGYLKAFRDSHEVIVTMMLNFVAAGISSYVIVNVIPNQQSQNPESFIISDSFRTNHFDFINTLFPDSPANLFLLLAIFTAIMLYLFFEKTLLGYELKVSGENPLAAERAGIPVKKMMIIAMVLSGLFASGSGMNEVMGFSGQFKMGFSPEFGFIGIAVALMSNNNPLGIMVSAFLMGALHKGASDLDFETETITRDFSKILQAMIIFGVGFQYYLNKKFFRGENGSH
ncbi:MAG: ABC transporter permease [Bdellovibrionaceae bacterium]|nr:ABC transporter permease [Pseudobdellovibrionaceae bacterium]